MKAVLDVHTAVVVVLQPACLLFKGTLLVTLCSDSSVRDIS